MRKKLIVLALLVAVIGAVVWGTVTGPSAPGRPRAGFLNLGGANSIGIIYIEGVIGSGRSYTGLLGDTVGSDQVLSYLKEAREDPRVKAIVIRINSPGGSAAGSQEIASEIEKVKGAGKKVIVSMGDVAASGAYWIASSADRVVADPATITGSIGVIIQMTNLRELYKKLGIEHETVKSGPHKDIGSATRPLTPEELAILRGMVDDIHQQFVDVVSQGRKLDRRRVLALADGRIYTGRQALNLGLVDQLGNFYDAIDTAAEMAGLGPYYGIKEYGRLSPLERLLGRISGQSIFGGEDKLLELFSMSRGILRLPID